MGSDRDVTQSQDIVIKGLGIAGEHCVFAIDKGEIYVTPCLPAKLFVNGRLVTERTRLRHGYRLLIGSNHLFRVNCPRKAASPTNQEGAGEVATGTSEGTDWEMAQEELMKSDQDWELEKQFALDEQRKLYEKRLAELDTTTGSRDAAARQLAQLVSRRSCWATNCAAGIARFGP